VAQSPTGQHAHRTAPVPWEHLAEARTWPKIVEAFAARGHGTGEHLIDVRVSPAFLADYRGLTAGRSLPAGTIIVAFHRNRVTGDAGSVYAMSKQPGGAWEYLVAAPNGAIEARGALPLCGRCHAEAPADSVFGVRASTAHPPELPEAAPRSPSN
jgi:hypothetical protein